MISSPCLDGTRRPSVEQRSSEAEDRFDIRDTTNQNRPDDE